MDQKAPESRLLDRFSGILGDTFASVYRSFLQQAKPPILQQASHGSSAFAMQGAPFLHPFSILFGVFFELAPKINFLRLRATFSAKKSDFRPIYGPARVQKAAIWATFRPERLPKGPRDQFHQPTGTDPAAIRSRKRSKGFSSTPESQHYQPMAGQKSPKSRFLNNFPGIFGAVLT